VTSVAAVAAVAGTGVLPAGCIPTRATWIPPIPPV